MTNDTAGLTAHKRAQIERERQAAIVRSHIVSSYDDREPTGGDVYLTGSHRRRMPGWGSLVERAWQAQGATRNLDDEPYHDTYTDPDDLQHENEALGTPDAVVIDSMARRRR